MLKKVRLYDITIHNWCFDLTKRNDLIMHLVGLSVDWCVNSKENAEVWRDITMWL